MAYGDGTLDANNVSKNTIPTKQTLPKNGEFHTLEGQPMLQDQPVLSIAATGVNREDGQSNFSWQRFELETPNYVTQICWRGLNPMGDTSTQSNGFIAVADNAIHVMHVTHAVDHDSDRTNMQIDLL